MKISAFIQAYNELSSGHLTRCLDNVSLWSDDIFIYDDCSTDGSQDVYLKYTKEKNIILGKERSFKREQFNKAKLLDLTLEGNPDWIFWIDADAIPDRTLTTRLKDILSELNSLNVDGVVCHNLNLWRHPAFYRLDDQFNSYNPLCLWKNNGSLKYSPTDGLHGQLFPNGMSRVVKVDLNLLHYGFASEKWIVDKYNLYKSLGQTGWALNRLVTEGPGFEVQKVSRETFPEGNIPEDYDSVLPLARSTYLSRFRVAK